jgi:hypothetical protein
VIGVLDHAQLAPSRRSPQQLHQHPLRFRTCIGRLRSHCGAILTLARRRVEQRAARNVKAEPLDGSVCAVLAFHILALVLACPLVFLELELR